MTPAHVLLFATSFSMVGITTGLALVAGSNPITIVTIRTLIVLGLFLAYFRFAGVSLAMSGRERAIAIAIGVSLCANNYALNEALAHIPVPLAVLIFYLWPAITTGASWALGRERFRWRSLCGLLLAFAGLALALNVDFTAAQAKGIWLALASAVAFSVTFLLVDRFFRGRDSRPVTFYMTLTTALVFVLLLATTRDLALPLTAVGWTAMIGLPFFYAFGMIGLFVATVSMGPARTGFYMNFEPIATVLLSALLLSQTLAPIQLAGASLVIAALFLFRPLRRSPPEAAGKAA